MERTKKILKWKPKTNFLIGLRKTINYYRKIRAEIN